MGDNLVKRARHNVALIEALADRTEELEAKLSGCEARLMKAVEALGKVCRLVGDQYGYRLYNDNTAGWEACVDDIKDVARTTLAELNKERSDEKGQDR